MTEGLNPTMSQPSPWIPMSDPVTIAKFGKLAEELGELQSAVARCMIQGVNGSHPKTEKPNIQWLKEEIADVLANIAVINQHLGIDADVELSPRVKAKCQHLAGWHELIIEATS